MTQASLLPTADCSLHAGGGGDGPLPTDPRSCPNCVNPDLTVADFGKDKSCADGINRYCKPCNRKKSKKDRRVRKLVESKGGNQISLLGGELVELRALTPVERVRRVIETGTRTRKEIATETKLSSDDLDDAVAELLLWTREISVKTEGNTRIYSLREPPQHSALSPQHSALNIERKPDVPSGFASITQLMPLRITGERKAG